jgi:hypothetical protein
MGECCINCINAQRALIESNLNKVSITKIAVLCLACNRLWASEKAKIKEVNL